MSRTDWLCLIIIGFLIFYGIFPSEEKKYNNFTAEEWAKHYYSAKERESFLTEWCELNGVKLAPTSTGFDTMSKEAMTINQILYEASLTPSPTN